MLAWTATKAALFLFTRLCLLLLCAVCSLFRCYWDVSRCRRLGAHSEIFQNLNSIFPVVSFQMMCLPTLRRNRFAASFTWNATGWCWPAWLRAAGPWSLNGSTTTQSWRAFHWSTGEGKLWKRGFIIFTLYNKWDGNQIFESGLLPCTWVHQSLSRHLVL